MHRVSVKQSYKVLGYSPPWLAFRNNFNKSMSRIAFNSVVVTLLIGLTLGAAAPDPG